MKIKTALILVISFLQTGIALGNYQVKCGNLHKKNAAHLFGSTSNPIITNGMTKERFLQIIKTVSDVYGPIIESKGGVLIMDNNWENNDVDASADRDKNKWIVEIDGGLGRYPLVTVDGLALAVCHELGHHLGGAPTKSKGGRFGNSWGAASEGEADYFGSLKCMKRVFEKDDNVSAILKIKVDEEVTKQCGLVYKNSNEIALCQRIAMAGKSLALLFANDEKDMLGFGKAPEVSFNTPDTKIAKKTIETNPTAQCRLDTYFNASLCDKPFTEELSSESPIPGACIKKDGYNVGPRPLCWYKPGTDE